MTFAVNTEQMRAAEQNAFAPGNITAVSLMESAGEKIALYIDRLLSGAADKTAVFLCGRGGNGGDGIAAAAVLKSMGLFPLVVFVDDLPNGDTARTVFTKYCGAAENSAADAVPYCLYTHREDAVMRAVISADVVVDCVYGIGFGTERALDQRLRELFTFIRESRENNTEHLTDRQYHISVDVPSGICADSGNISQGAFKPDITLCLGAAKAGLFNYPAFDYSGEIAVLDIGIPGTCYSAYTAKFSDSSLLSLIPARKKNQHKGSFGKLLNIAGSERYIGAALLSTRAALRAGTGIVTLAAPRAVTRVVAAAAPEATFLPFSGENDWFLSDAIDIISGELSNFSAVSVGCGLGQSDDCAKIIEMLLSNVKSPVVFDADGINLIAAHNMLTRDKNQNHDRLRVFTPHPGEFARLLGVSAEAVQADRIALASRFARENGAVIVLKGAASVIAGADGRVLINVTGNAGLAKGGSGDCLTGIIAGFAAQGIPIFEAAALGTYLHGLAADTLINSVSAAAMLPSDLLEILPFVMKR